MLQPAAATASSNKFGFLRLLLAALVIVSHSPEMVDGDRSREILVQIFGTLSLGEAAVDGFFLISGYLIVPSVMRSPTRFTFIRKRLLRIVPGFVVAYLATLLVVGPLVGGNLAGFTAGGIAEAAERMALLLGPKLEGAFSGLPRPQLNSAMWTIAYEFRCYVMALLLAEFGVLSRPRLYVAFTAVVFAASAAMVTVALPAELTVITGTVHDSVRFASIFLVGGGFYLLRDTMPAYRARTACGCGVATVAALFIPAAAEPGLVIAGGYVLFWFALGTSANRLNAIGQKTDISYGLYLYAWPVQNAVIWFWADVTPALVTLVSLPIAAALGYVSWTLVESRALTFGRERPKGTSARRLDRPTKAS